MDPSRERWRRIEDVLDAALDSAPADRAALLDAACAGDAELRREVDRLLRAHDSAAGFLDQPAHEFAASLLLNASSAVNPAVPGGRIGPYRIVREIGRGGMAVVYLAERDDGAFQRRVALKLVQDGRASNYDLLRRFREERQILASLEHPNIAHLLDGGVTDEGAPWFAMEYVDGTPIDRYCDEQRLPVDARLELFGTVCDAVDHAHRNRIVHRDLKPANILVTAEGRVKLLDFGIAKILADGTEGITGGDGDNTVDQTRAGARLMTPGYASPEQVRGERASPPTDVYALGVVLYRLLCGRRPDDRVARGAGQPATPPFEPPSSAAFLTPPFEPPSSAILRMRAHTAHDAGEELKAGDIALARGSGPEQLRARLRGDLDSIVLKALSFERGHRYADAGALAADVRHHLQGRRVGARRELRTRAARAFARSPRGLVAASALVALLAVTGYGLLRPAATVLDPQRVLVAPFENRSGVAALDAVSSIAADWIRQGLAETGVVQVLPVTTSLTASRFVLGSPDGSDTAQRTQLLAQETGAGLLVTGAFYQQGDSLYIWAAVTDATQRRVLHATQAVATPISLPLPAIELLRMEVMRVVAPRFDPRTRDQLAHTSTLPAYEAYRAFVSGLDRFVARDWRAAIALFAVAAAIDPDFSAPDIYAGIAYGNIGELRAVDSLVEVMRPRLAGMLDTDRAAFAMLDARVRGDHAAAYRAQLRNPHTAPGTLAHWGLANSALAVNRPRETVRVSHQLDPDRGELRGWFLYWRDLAEAHHRLGAHRAELRVARRARELFPADPAALRLEIRALAAMRRTRELDALLNENLRTEPAPAALLRYAGLELVRHGSASAGEALLRRSIDWQRERPSDSDNFRLGLAVGYLAVGEWAEAEPLLLTVAATRPDSPEMRGLLGTVAARRGDRVEAQRLSDWLAALDRPYLNGSHTLWRARIAALLGESQRAVQLLEQAYDEGSFIWTGIHVEPDFASLWDYAPYRAFLRPRG